MYENFIQQHPFFDVVAASCPDIIIFVVCWMNNSWLTHILRENIKNKPHTRYTVNKLNVRRVNHNINYMMIMF